MKFAIAKKIGMTRSFSDKGVSVPLNIISIIPAKISQLKNNHKDGYQSVQIEDNKNKGKKKYEFRVENSNLYKLGQNISSEQFEKNDLLTIKGRSKGKGFSGVIKRHGFSRGPMSHGSNHHRAPGSIGGRYPQRVVKGKKMPGRLGGKGHTQRGIKVVDVDMESNILLVSGSIPGGNKSIIKIESVLIK